MKYVAEITLRTVPFEAEDPDDARAKTQQASAETWWGDLIDQVVEFTVTELEDID